jgi:TRAP-type uncharacterized transport system substrate-binding protein
MSKNFFASALIAAAGFASPAFAQANLTAETASPGGAVHLAPSHLTEIAGTSGIANIQLSEGQTLTNSIQNVAEGKTDIASAPHILPFLMARGVGPYGSLGKEKGAELASNLRAIYPYTLGVFFLFAFDSKNIGGWDDLEGRTIYNGPPRGGALTNARAIIQIAKAWKMAKATPVFRQTGVKPLLLSSVVNLMRLCCRSCSRADVCRRSGRLVR